MDNLNNQSEFKKNDNLEYIDFKNIDIIKYVIDKYRSAHGSEVIDALLYSIYMGTKIIEEEQKTKTYTFKR